MPRVLSDAQLANVQGPSTRPVYLVDWEHSGVQELIACTSGDVIYDSMTFVAGDLRLNGIPNGRSARLSMPASAARAAETISGSWRQGLCKIYLIPALPDDEMNFAAADGILVLDGQIRTSSIETDNISVTVEHIAAGSRLSPRHTFDAVCNHLPAAGTVISWEGDTVVLEPPR